MPINSQTGQAYTVIPATGGSWHVYAGGKKVFVKAGAVVPAPAAPASDPGQLAPDAQYVTDTAKSIFDTGQNLDTLDDQGVAAKAAHAEALRRMGIQQPKDEYATKTSANKQGMLYSSRLGEKLSDVATQYAQRRGDEQAQFDAGERARVRARQAIEAGYGVDDAARMAASADRQVTRNQGAADSGNLAPNVASPAPQAAAAPRAKAYKTTVARGNVFHTYPGGRRVAVRKRKKPA